MDSRLSYAPEAPAYAWWRVDIIDESIPVFIYGVFNGKGNRWEDNTGKNNICENIQVHFYLIKSLKSGL